MERVINKKAVAASGTKRKPTDKVTYKPLSKTTSAKITATPRSTSSFASGALTGATTGGRKKKTLKKKTY